MIWQITIFLLVISAIARGIFQMLGDQETYDASDGIGQTTGNKDVQADAMELTITEAGKLAVMADGMGKYAPDWL